MSASQIEADAGRYDAVWGSFDPGPWRSSNPAALVSRYYIPEEDNELISGHDLQWWQQNHPDWILYACTANGTPTHDIAYTPGDGFPDVPLDLHNPSVVNYQIEQSLLPYVEANGYNAVAIDQLAFTDIMKGGNPELGQTETSGEYGCGIWNADGSFTTVYQSPSDPQWATDMLNWMAQLRSATSSAGVAVMVNHAGNPSDPNEQALMHDVDVVLDETGFSDYGNYVGLSSYFMTMYRYMEWVQSQGIGFIDVDRYAFSNETSPSSDQIEYSIATYLMADEGDADLYVNADNGPGYGYGSEQYHQEYATPIGTPCDAMYGGSSYDASTPQLYYRRFSGGMVIVNAGSSGAENAMLPANHEYVDIEGRPVSNPLTVNPADAYVLTTTNGCA